MLRRYCSTGHCQSRALQARPCSDEGIPLLFGSAHYLWVCNFVDAFDYRVCKILLVEYRNWIVLLVAEIVKIVGLMTLSRKLIVT